MGKKTSSTKKRGAPEHWLGTKLKFLTDRAISYQQSLDTGTVTQFYDKVTQDFIAKWGKLQPFTANLEEDPPDPEVCEFGEEEAYLGRQTKAEAEASAVLYSKLRNKLAQWYREKYKRPAAINNASVSSNPIALVLATAINKPPRKLIPFH